MKVYFQHILLIVLFATGMVSCTDSMKSYKNEYEILMDKIRADFVTNPDAGEINESLKLFNKEKGCFTDVDYRRDDRTNWPPMTHLTRLANFAHAYTNPDNYFYRNETMYNSVLQGLNYWYAVNPQCNNWWYNQIAEPQTLGLMMIQMRLGKKKLPADVEKKTIERMIKEGGNPAKWTGANRTDISLHWMYRACLMEDEATLNTALKNAFSPIYYTTKEGFQHDNSYMQHGRQLYIGGYGDEILKGITQIAAYTAGTKFAIPADKLAILSKFMRETFYQTIRGKYMMFDVLGRGMSRPDILNKENTAKFAQRMIALDTEHADEFRQIVRRIRGEVSASQGVKSMHNHYFGSDYTLHVRPEYTFDTRMVSTRTMRCEYGNGENLDTYFLSDGCTGIVRYGDEYYNIFPVWNWYLIPGITAPRLDKMPMAISDWKTPGTSTFTGGVTDGMYGATAYSYYDNYSSIHTGANKSWFYFDNEVVCMGNVSSHAGREVQTSINQCMMSDARVYVNDGSQTAEVGKGKHSYNNPQWVFHRGIGYVFPNGGNVFVYNQEQTGSWYRINRSMEKGEKVHEVFTIGLDYDKNSTNKSYAYIVVPTVDTWEELREYTKIKQVQIVANTQQVQSVYHKALDIWQTVFFKAGSVKLGDIRLVVDQSCIVMLKNGRLYICDPKQRQETITVTVHKDRHVSEITADFKGTGIYAGMTKSFELNKK